MAAYAARLGQVTRRGRALVTGVFVLPLWRIHRHIGMGGDQLLGALTDERTEREQGDDIRGAEKTLYVELIDEVDDGRLARADRGPQAP